MPNRTTEKRDLVKRAFNCTLDLPSYFNRKDDNFNTPFLLKHFQVTLPSRKTSSIKFFPTTRICPILSNVRKIKRCFNGFPLSENNSVNATTAVEIAVENGTSVDDNDYNDKDRFCGAILCGSGRECLRQEGAPPTCVCKASCADRMK